MTHQPTTRDTEASGKYLCFCLGHEKFAMPLLQVKEIIANSTPTKVPQAPPYFYGLLNLRGLVISIVDLRLKLKIGKADAKSESTIVILDLGGPAVGVVVDSAESVTSFGSDQISDPPFRTSAATTDCIVGVARKDKELTLIIDLHQVLAADFATVARLAQHPAA